MRSLKAVAAIGCSVLVFVSACQESADKDAPGASEITETNTSDHGQETVGKPDSGPDRPKPGVGRVEVDLSEFEEGNPGAFLRKITDKKDLLTGPAAQGRVGDWLIGNERVRFIVQGKDRHSGPCPYGGNVIDASYVAQGKKRPDVLGESCTFVQLGRTLLPEQFEVISDGTKGPAILAITGTDTLLDFINISSLIESFLGAGIALPVDSNIDLPLTITHYFILSADSNAVRQITAFRNDDTETTLHLIVGDLVDSGGTVEFFNPASTKKGFGYQGYLPESMDFLAFRGAESSYAYVPDLGAKGALNASYLAISGVAGIALGTADVLPLLTGPAASLPDHPATMNLKPGAAGSVGKWLVVGDSSVSSLTDTIYAARDVETGTIDVVVKDVAGNPVAGHRVSIGKTGAMTQGVTDKDGQFSAAMPVGTWNLIPDSALRRVVAADEVIVKPGESTQATIQLENQGRLVVDVVDALGDATPGKISVLCVDKCPGLASSAERDVSFDRLPDGIQAVRFLGVDGQAKIPLPSGDYRLVVSRGPLWSVWPNDDLSGKEFSVKPGEDTVMAASIRKVIPTPGWMSGDLHVHAVNSPDSPIDNPRRVRSMMAEGVDVLVSTDHDYITDYAPVVAKMGAQDEIATVAGEELTTFDYGHFNAFPLDVNADDLTGGALDWGNGEGSNLHPADIFEGLQSHSGEQVIQVNHPLRGYFIFTKLDPATGMTFESADKFRIQSEAPDPDTGDTGLFSDKWTALEALSGLGSDRFYQVAGYWFTFLNRGIIRTATAVSDTHKSIATQSGGSRTYVFMGDKNDTPQTFDSAVFAQNINAGKAVGSNGPFVELTAEDANGNVVGLGETLKLAQPGDVTFHVRVSVPKWMRFNRIELVGNVTDASPPPGGTSAVKFEPLITIDVTLSEADLVDDQRYESLVNIPFPVDKDGWFIVLVHGKSTATQSMYPVLPKKDVAPFAFTNPILVDIGNDGWLPPMPDPMPSAPSESDEHASRATNPAGVVSLEQARELLEHLRTHYNCSD